MNWFKKIKYFIYHENGYTTEKRIYQYGIDFYIGYILYYEYHILGIVGYDKIGIFHDKNHLDNFIKISNIKL
jgi:hypothetical protein